MCEKSTHSVILKSDFLNPCAAAFFLQVPKSCTDLDPTLLYISITVADSYGKIKCQRSAFASRSHTRALAAGFLHQAHVWITTDQLSRFHTK